LVAFFQLDVPSWSTLFSWVVVLIDIVTIGAAIYRGQGVDRTIAWILAIIALPIIGPIAYFALARPSVRRTARRRRRASASVRRAGAADEFAWPRLGEADEVYQLERPLLSLASELTELPPTHGNQVELLAEDTQAFQRMEEAIQAAEKFIWAEYYLIRNDRTGHRFMNLLSMKARQGVSVRLLYDAVGSLGLGGKRLAAIRAAGGRAEAFLPLNPLRRRWAVHLRNHRKLVIVDGRVGFTGGMNVADEYSGRARRRNRWHFRDYHLALRGPAVGQLAQTFIEDWAFATDETLQPGPRPEPLPGASSIVAMIPSGPDQQPNASSLTYFSGIAAARERIFLSTPYFIPDEPTIRALLAAGMRGLDVRILLPAQNDVKLVQYAARCYYQDLLDCGVRIFEYQPSMLHSKSLVVDGTWGLVGSANVDIRSFRLNFELSALVVDPAFARVLEQRFEQELAESREITSESLDHTGFFWRLRDRTAMLLSPLL
jgi:cardiolipin synthase